MIDINNRTIWSSTAFNWDDNPYIWSDVEILTEITSGYAGPISTYHGLDKKKRRRVIKLICNIKGQTYTEEKFEVLDKKISVKDIKMLTDDINKHIKLEVHV